MKKYLFMLLAIFSLVACEKDDEKGGNDLSAAAQAVESVDCSSALGMSQSKMIATYGEPAENYGNFYIYNSKNEKVEMIMLALNPDNSKVYTASIVLIEGAYTEAAIKEYLSSKYTCYGYDEEEAIYTYGNDEDKEKATIAVVQSGANSIVWTDVQNEPSFEEPEGNFEELDPTTAVSMFLGLSEADIMQEYGKSLLSIGNSMYMGSVENEWLSSFALTMENEKVVSIILLYNEELSDDDIIAYYEALGFKANDLGEDEEGATAYLFMNSNTGEMFTYSAGRAVFMDLSGLDEDETNDDDD